LVGAGETRMAIHRSKRWYDATEMALGYTLVSHELVWLTLPIVVKLTEMQDYGTFLEEIRPVLSRTKLMIITKEGLSCSRVLQLAR